MTVEQLAAKLLYEITRNTGFETEKSQVDVCFINTCCEWAGRQNNDICGLEKPPLALPAYLSKKPLADPREE